MCGIWALFGYDHSVSSELHHALQVAHRGPDFFRIETVPHFKHSFLAFHRLSIIDHLTGHQPLRLYELPHLHLIYNGEIYNYRELGEEYNLKFTTKVDGEVILHLFNMFGIEKTASLLDGDFAVCIFDSQTGQVHLARDTFGVRPLFTLHPSTGELGICSEVKGLIGLTTGNGHVSQVQPFPPGSFASYEICRLTGKAHLLVEGKYTDVDIPQKFKSQVQLTSDIKENIRLLFTESVRKRLMAERRIGCLLSGGLDSSLVAALVVKITRDQGLPYPLQTFSVGFPGSTDLAAAKKVADMLGTEHHEVIFTRVEAIEALDKVIHSLESYDITTVRASVCMYLIGKYIRENTDTVVIFSGEGSDELAQGYIYFHKAPSADEAHEESKRLLRDLYLYDNLRADRTTAAHGLELRVPFLDKTFTSYYLSLPREMVQPTNGVEKYLLRSSFHGYLDGLLPQEILWRAKEAFSDGVSSVSEPWFITLQKHAESVVSDDEFHLAAGLYPFNTPKTKEAFLYRQKFESKFKGQSHLTPYYWLPRWMGNATDPSARTLSHYKQ